MSCTRVDHPPAPRPAPHRPDPDLRTPNSATKRNDSTRRTAPSASTKPAAVPATNRGWCNRIAMVQTSSLGPTHSDSLVASVQTSTFIRIGEPQCPALHNRRFRPSWFTQPPAGAHVNNRRSRRVPSMRLYLQRAPPVAATVDGAGCVVRMDDGAGRALSGRRLGACCAAARLSAATPPNGRAVLGRRLY